MLPDYLTKAVPNPAEKRAPWYVNTAPTYFGVFLWFGFYQSIGEGTLTRAGLVTCLAAIAVGAVLSWFFYYAPAMLGMKTGFPLYVVASSTFGVRGGYVIPSLLMGAVQIGAFGLSTYLASSLILKALRMPSSHGSLAFTMVALVWGYATAWVGANGIRYVARVALLVNVVPFLMILVVFLRTRGGIGLAAPPPAGSSVLAFALLVQIVVGYFATAGAAGADFGMNSRNGRDVLLGGIVGIVFAALYTAGLPLLSIAGAHALHPELQGYTYDAVIGAIGGFLASTTFALYAMASICGACFSIFIAGNTLATMIPGVPRISSTMIGATISVLLAVTGIAANIVKFFQFAGAAFGPICGAMLADYLLAGRRWSGPRKGINLAGYGAWGVGFLIGVIPFLPLPESLKLYSQPATLYSFLAGFLAYLILAKAGLEPRTVEEFDTHKLLLFSPSGS
jgi:cytosine permease